MNILMNYVFPRNEYLASVVAFLISFAATPVTSFGMYRIVLRLMRGKKAEFTMLVNFLNPPHRLAKVYVASLVMHFSYFATLFITHFSSWITNLIGQGIATIILLLCLFIAYFWILLRLFLFPFLFITAPDESIWSLIQASFRRMKGEVRHVLWFEITAVFPIILAYTVFIVISVMHTYHTGSQLFSTLSINLIIYLIALFFLPYFNLCIAGYADGLLNPDVSKKPRRKQRRLPDQP